MPAPQGLLPEALALFRQVGCWEQQGYDGLHGVFMAVAPAHVPVKGGPAPPTPSAISRAVFPRPSSRQRLSSESPLAFPFPGSCGASFRILKAARRGPACSEPPPRTPVSGPSLVGAMGGDGWKQLGRRFLQARPDSSLSVASSSVLSLCIFPSGLVARTAPLLTARTLVLQPSQLFLSPQPELFPLIQLLLQGSAAFSHCLHCCWQLLLVLVPRAGSASLILLERSPRG